jgi:hypothetical protein
MIMTAVEFLYERLERMIPRTALYNMDKEDYFKQANELFEQQIKDAFNAGVNSEDFFCPPFEISESEQYYNKTYKNK